MIPNDDIQMQSRRFGGNHVGPQLLITAGIHGDEYLPMLAVRELIRRFESDRELLRSLRGTLILIPIANYSAYHRGHRSGDDALDLARTFPGRQGGTITERVAYELSQQITAANYYIDLHTGGTELCVLPLAGYVLHSDHAILEQQRRMACAFQLPLVWGTSAKLQGRSLSVARDAGVPAIYVEYLGAHRELSEVASGGLKTDNSDHPLIAGCFNVMRHLGMLAGVEAPTTSQEVIEDWRTGSGHMQVCNPAPASGFLTPQVKLGQQVSRGSLLAEIDSDRGDQKHFIVSQQEGIVVVLREYPRINQGDAVAVIAENHEAS